MNNTREVYKFLIKLIALSLLLLIVSSALLALSRRLYSKNDIEYTSIELEPKLTVILDAGHGGADSGASINGIHEKDLNLQITKAIAEFLRVYDLNVVMTRSDDFLLANDNAKNKKREDLLNRVKVASDYDAPIFISVHTNKFPEEKYKGLQVFFSRNNSYSEALSLKIQSNNKKYLEADNERNVKAATSSIYVLDRLFCPAVLIECGFMSNASDLAKLTDGNYQQHLAFVIANSIVEYIGL